MRLLSSAAIVMFVPLQVAAQEPPAGPAAVKGDPNQVVCKSRPNVGSRLGGTKTCKTRQEWADMRQQTRETLEKTQQLWQKN